MNHLKSTLCQILHTKLDQKITVTRRAITDATESRNSNTKSSAGDKYETGRAMMQQELDKLESQLDQTLLLKQELSRISLDKKHERVEPGSLVFTNQGVYFIAFGFGKLEMEEDRYYVISMASPIGQILGGKRVGDSVNFQGKEINLVEII